MTDKKASRTLKELIAEYKVSRATFLKWIKPIMHKLRYKEEKRRILTAREVKYIYDFLDNPGE